MVRQKYPTFNQEVFSQEELKQKYDDYIESREKKNLPSLGLSLLPIVLPIALIFIKAILGLLAKNTPELAQNTLYQVFNFIGHPMIALAISVLVAVYIIA